MSSSHELRAGSANADEVTAETPAAEPCESVTDGTNVAVDADGASNAIDEDPCDPSFFEEEAECMALLARAAELLPPTNAQLLPSLGEDPQGVAAMLEGRFAKIVDRYQDSPHLLHPYLEVLMQPLVDLLLRYLPNAAEVWAREAAGVSTSTAAGAAPPAPHSSASASPGAPPPPQQTLVVASTLGQDLTMFDSDAPKSPLHVVCKTLYTIIKTAGEKCCTSHFPNNVSHYEDVFYTLQQWVADPTRQREWEVRYCLLLWLSNLVLVPFSLSLIDTNEATTTAASTVAEAPPARLTLSDATLVTASRFLADTSKCREAAALLVARLLTRPDSARHRQLFFDFTMFILRSSSAAAAAAAADEAGEKTAAPAVPSGAAWAFLVEGTQSTFNSLLSQPFLLPGVLLAIAKTMKLGRREELVPFAASLLACVATVYEQHPNDSLLCKTAVKVGQRLVLVMLKKKKAGWRYRRHIASLSANLAATTSAAAGGGSGGVEGAEKQEEEANEEDDDDVLDGDEDSLETGIGLLLQAIGHKDTVVRWSAAKGVGRVCERLPAAFAEEVMEAVLEVFANAHSDAHWHGGLLTIAELCRRSLVRTALLARVVPLVASGLAYDLSKGTYSVGAHVRDAACYTCWSIARAYDADDLVNHVRQLSVALIVTALFDREVNVRRAAAAAFQECVGRLGSFEHGIELVTTVDFFSLATLRHAYTVVAPLIAQYATYRDGMLHELVSVKLLHWDKHVRQMAAVSLGLVAVQEPIQTTLQEILPELLRRVEDTTVATRHGAILAAAELIRSLPPATWSPTHVGQFIHILTSLESSRGFRLRGGEYIRQACCGMLQAMAAQSLPLPETVEVTRLNGRVAKVRTLEVVYSFLKDSWLNILEWVQEAAANTFAVVAQTYFATYHPVFHGKILAELFEGCGIDQPPMRRRGFLAAAGGLPATLVNAPWSPTAGNDSASTEHTDAAAAPRAFAAFLPLLQRSSLLSEADVLNPELADAEGRRNAVRALSHMLVLVDLSLPTATPAWYADVVQMTMLTALQDYATDKRGDVGSFVRLAVLEALPLVMRYGLQQRSEAAHPSSPSSDASATHLCTPRTALCVLQGVVRCLLEKLDRVRAAAGAVLVTLLLEEHCGAELWAAAAGEEEGDRRAICEELLQFAAHIASLCQPPTPLPWHNTQQVMSRVGPYVLMRCPFSLAHAAMEGLVVAAGDLSEHVRKPATAALLDAFHGLDGVAASDAAEDSDTVSTRLSACLMAVIATHEHEERMLKPASRALDLLINAGVFAVEQHRGVLEMLRKELKHFALNIIVLLAMVPLLANLCCSSDADVRRGAWALALTMIASRYPKVRSKVATDFYSSLLMLTSDSNAEEEGCGGLPLDGCKAAMVHLQRVQWDGGDAKVTRAARDKLYGMLQIDPPAARAKASEVGAESGRAPVRPAREQGGAVAATYKSLVQETGY